MTDKCGAVTKRGGKCTRAAGWGTDHKGEGYCRDHDVIKSDDSFKNEWLVFANNILKGASIIASYKLAYPNCTDESAMAAGSRLLRNVKVSEYLKERWKAKAASVEELISLQSDVARADMGDFISVLPDGEATFDLSNIFKNGTSKLIKKIKHTKRTIPQKDDDPIEINTYELELLDSQKAQVDLLKLHGKFNHALKVEVTIEDKIVEGLKRGRISPDEFKNKFPNLADKFFQKAGISIDS